MSILPTPNEGREPPKGEPLAEVIPLVPRLPETAEVTDLEPAERVQLFLAQFRHPSIVHRSTDVIADIITRQLYSYIPARELDSFSDEDLSMRLALLPLSIDSNEMELDALDEFSEQDPIYERMIALTMATKPRAKDFLSQRRALLALEDFRLGTKIRSFGDISGSDEDWRGIIKLLFPNSSF